MRTKVVVLVIIIVTVLLIWESGQGPVTAVSLVLGAGLAGTQVARALVAGSTPSRRSLLARLGQLVPTETAGECRPKVSSGGRAVCDGACADRSVPTG